MRNGNNLFRTAILLALLFFAGRANAQDTINVSCTEDFYLVDAQYTITIDSTTVKTGQTCTAHNVTVGTPTGATPQTTTFTGNYGGASVAHKITITFLNDGWGGSAAQDRNLFITNVTFDSHPTTSSTGGFPVALYTTGANAIFTTAIVTAPPIPPSVSTITITASSSLSCGTATPPPSTHSVQLAWVASISTSAAGYNVYRGTVSGGPYTKLTAVMQPGTTYLDGSVASGATYYYVVTALDAAGNESANSNQASASIP